MKICLNLKKTLILKSVLAATFVAVGCSSKGSFNSSSSPVVRKKFQPAVSTPKENDANAAIKKETPPGNGSNGEAVTVVKPGDGTNGEALAFPPVPLNPCTPKDKPYRILIVDLKSGWFAGDGQEFFKDFLKLNCSQTLEVVYAHLTINMIETNFTDPLLAENLFPCLGGVFTKQGMNTIGCTMGDIKGFDQAWMLSGSQADFGDLQTSGNFYSSIKQRFTELKASNSKVSFFFSSGLGNTDHSNDMAVALFPDLASQSPTGEGKVFGNNKYSPKGTLPNKAWGQEYPSTPLKSGNGLDKGTFLSSFPAFKDLTGIFDYRDEPHTYNNVALGNCFTDPVVAANVKTVMVDHCGQSTAAAGIFGSHKVYLEGNTARFYGTRTAGQLQTGQVESSDYFMRIISYLM